MTAESLFPWLNAAAMIGWLALVLVPRRRWATTTLPIAMPVALGREIGRAHV